MSVLTRWLAPVVANEPSQMALEKVAKFCLNLMGVGAGSRVQVSGERCVLEPLRDRTGAPVCVFDVGANRGQFLQAVLEVLGDKPARIHCFEPSSDAFADLQGMAGGDSRIHLEHLALGRDVGTATLYFEQPGSGLASLTRRRLEHFQLSMELSQAVEVTTLDTYCERNGIEHIDLLKIDVEGHEMDVLVGGERLLRERRVDSVLFEFGGCNIDTRTFFQDFYYLFRDYGMQLYRVTPGGFPTVVREYREIYEQFRTTNFWARRAA